MSSSGKKCSNCGSSMQGVGIIRFRVGGDTGGVAMILGTMNELSEDIQPFAAIKCPSCNKVDLYAVPKGT